MTSSWNATGPTGSLRQGDQPDGPPLDDLPVGSTFEPCADMTVGSLRQGAKGTVDFNFTQGRGAGRTFEAVWPPNYAFNTGNGIGIDTLSRYGVISVSQQTKQQDPGDSIGVYYKGRCCVKLRSATGVMSQIGPYFTFAKAKGGAPHKGDFASWRVKAILAFEPSGVGDLGLVIAQDLDSTNGNFFGGNIPGMTLRAVADNTVTFWARANQGTGIYSISDVCPIEIDITEFNCYEFRYIGATADTDAQLKVIINNVLQFTHAFDGVLLPFGGMLGVQIKSESGGNCYVPVGGCLLAGAYDEASTL